MTRHYGLLLLCPVCRRIEAQKRKDRNEALLYFSVEVYRDDDFQQHTGPDLISDNPPTTTFKVLKTDSLEVFKSDLAEALVRALVMCGMCGSQRVWGCSNITSYVVEWFLWMIKHPCTPDEAHEGRNVALNYQVTCWCARSSKGTILLATQHA